MTESGLVDVIFRNCLAHEPVDLTIAYRLFSELTIGVS